MAWQRIRQWWHRPDHYEWLSAYIENRGLQPYTRITIGFVVLGGGAAGCAMIWSPSGPSSVFSIAIPVIAGVIAMGCSTVWLTRWPRRRQSTVLVVLLDFCIASMCLVQRDPKAAALGGFVFALLAAYVASFHTPKYLASVAVTAVLATTICSLRLAAQGDAQLALAVFVGLVTNTLLLPLAVHVLVMMLGDDSAVAHLDPLTQLPNRRGFEQAMRPMLANPHAESDISVILLDLDDFKRVNDTLGHAAGDRVLMHVAGVIMNALPKGGVAARIGGEEFVIAIHGHQAEAVRFSERLRRNIATKPWYMTASFGIAHAPAGTRPVMDQLLASADHAMYVAKRAGGDQVSTNLLSHH
ncbi:GGDEF domain-containing protein [Mycolicibacterium sp. CBMA 226]|uniref:GGDEF domain-containing protein n=1 Tax=Mycolicibacterium sp. CBMA 226 TaxID=2606611 RepID=UPI0012DD1FDA|nr:GGDEF domain-containing protein [Mycolicibacterium sp. CBMA 226]MUL74870.1 GGDEF domain-containing protein [Mycolicibacterium sp. CBMA 226]